MSNSTCSNIDWKIIHKLGATAAIGSVLVGILEIIITSLPGRNAQGVFE